jgi:hypothetical protein
MYIITLMHFFNTIIAKKKGGLESINNFTIKDAIIFILFYIFIFYINFICNL